jgi:Flp pilus assembly protein TadD
MIRGAPVDIRNSEVKVTRSAPARALRASYWLLALGLVVLNGWWFWLDRPPEDLKPVDSWIARGQLDEAEGLLRARLERSPDQGEARMKLARLLAKREDYLGCARQLHLVPNWSSQKDEALFLEGQSYKTLDRARDSEAAFKACTVADPLHPISRRYFDPAARELVGLYVLEGRIDEARQTLWRVYDIAAPVDHSAILVMRIRAELERIDHDEALKKLRRYAEVTPDDWDARRALALEEQGKSYETEADHEIKAALKGAPDSVAVRSAWLEILHQRGDRETITESLKSLPPDADSNAEMWKFRGLAAEWAGDFAGAVEAFTRATEIRPHEPELFYKLGIVEQRLGRGAQAREHIQKSKDLRLAFSKMHDAYYEFLKINSQSKPGDPEYQAVVDRMVAACDQLGFTREAEAWRIVPFGG